MKLRHVKTGVVLGSLVALGLASSATGQSTPKIWTSDPVADRQRLMKLNGASWADAQAKLKAGNVEAVAVNAETMALIATQITVLFPEGSLTEKLRDAARSKDQGATEAVAKEFGRQACGACHTPFRVPPPQQQAPGPPQQLQPR